MNKKSLWFLTLFSLVLVLSIYYVTMPNDLLLTSNNSIDTNPVVEIAESSLIETLKEEDNSSVLETINEYKTTISNIESTTEEKNKAFDEIKLLTKISSQEELLEEKIKNIYNLESFIKISGDEIRVVISSDEHNNSLANNIIQTIQNYFDTKKYITIQFK